MKNLCCKVNNRQLAIGKTYNQLSVFHIRQRGWERIELPCKQIGKVKKLERMLIAYFNRKPLAKCRRLTKGLLSNEVCNSASYAFIKSQAVLR